jgi:hypothetical protein
MTQQLIIVGTPNSREGDSLFAAFRKINENFTELYNTATADATDRLVNGDKSLILNTNGNLTFSQGTTLGYSDPGGFIIDGAVDKDISIYTYDGDTAHGWTFGTDGALTLPTVLAGNTSIGTAFNTNPPGHTLTLKHNGGVGGGSGGELKFDYGTAEIKVVKDAGITQTWTFSTDGSLASPSGSWTKTTNNSLSTGVASQVVWTSTVDYISGAKLTIQVEADETGGSGNWETQVCEAVIAVQGYQQISTPVMTVYGVTHTSVAPLMTFTVDRNPTTDLIEIVGTRTGTASSLGNASLRIYSVETGTND